MTTIVCARHPALRACALIAGLYALVGTAELITYLLTGMPPP